MEVVPRTEQERRPEKERVDCDRLKKLILEGSSEEVDRGGWMRWGRECR